MTEEGKSASEDEINKRKTDDDFSHHQKGIDNRHTPGPGLESPGKEKEGMTAGQLEKGPGAKLIPVVLPFSSPTLEIPTSHNTFCKS